MSYKVHCDRCNKAYAKTTSEGTTPGWKKVCLDFEQSKGWGNATFDICPACYHDVSNYLKGAQ